MKGLFITFEGIEGSGKSTQANRLKERLAGLGCEVDITREPGGTPIAESIREILLNPSNFTMAPTTELLLYQAARAQHVLERIRPALNRGVTVICDRFFDSTIAYQGGGRGLPVQELEALHAIATGGLAPDITFILDLSPEEGLSRARKDHASDRIEREALDFHNRVRNAFLDIAAVHPHRIRVIDATLPIDEISERVFSVVEPVVESR